MTGTVLILGATGRFGRHAAEAFWNRGWRVRLFRRGQDRLPDAAIGADVIVNAWNPPYHHWERDLPGLTAAVIDAAKVSGATVILPGNIYVYGRNAPETLDETTPHTARNRLGRLRIDMEAAYRASGVRTILPRYGDFIDTEPSGNWFEGVIAARAARGVFVAPGDPDAPHAWAFLPDAALAAVRLAEIRDRLGRFEEVPFPGHTLTLRELKTLVERATGRTQRLRRFPWWALRVAAPFWPMGRGLLEMRYLWSMPHRLDGGRLATLLPGFRATDPLTAVAAALDRQVQPDQTVSRSRNHVPAE